MNIDKWTFIFLRNDSVRGPLTQPYKGPYHVWGKISKTFSVDINQSKQTVSIDRVKQAFSETLTPEPNVFIHFPFPTSVDRYYNHISMLLTLHHHTLWLPRVGVVYTGQKIVQDYVPYPGFYIFWHFPHTLFEYSSTFWLLPHFWHFSDMLCPETIRTTVLSSACFISSFHCWNWIFPLFSSLWWMPFLIFYFYFVF